MAAEPITGVLFDLDDTLLDHRGAARAALATWTAQLGLVGALEEFEARWLHFETIYYRKYQARELTNAEHRRARIREFLAPRLFADDIEADQAFEGYWKAYVASWRAFDDAVSAIERARRAGLAVGILTNGDATNQGLKVSTTALAPLDLRIFASSDLPAAKPHAAAFHTACDSLGVLPSRCLMVGDSWENDIEGARGAGLPVAFLDRSGMARDDTPTFASLDALDFARLDLLLGRH
ncbi:HAD-IA family hydrolase [Devosia sp. D6-9]|nr:HAD-IA family hydrolase [Devosia sp. D6-9]